MAAREWRVPSFTRRGVSYLVSEAREGARAGWRCDCPAFGRRGTRECKHIRIAKAARVAIKNCALLGHGAGKDIPVEWLCLDCLTVLLARAAAKVARDYRPMAPKGGKKDPRARARRPKRNTDTGR